MASRPLTQHATAYTRTEAIARRWSLNMLVIAAVLLIGAALTALAWREAVQDERSVVDRALIAKATQIETVLIDRMMAYEALLLAGVGLFEASEEVSEEEWRAFALRLRAATLYPGLQGYGFAKRIAEGEHDSDALAPRDRTAIVYLEPLTVRNRAALGDDMMGEDVRRRAMERARDNGVAALSGRVTLVQEITDRKQPGFLIYLPVYQHGPALDSVAERREALIGFVYCPFRAEDFLTAVLGDLISDVHLEVFDAPQEAQLGLLFRSAARPALQAADFERSRMLELMGHSWLLTIRPTEAFLAARDGSDAQSVVLLGAAGTFLIAAFVWTLALSRTRLAQQLQAEQLASQRERHAAEILANSLDAYVSIDGDDRIVEWNHQAEAVFGWSSEEARGRRLADLIVPERYREPHLAAVRTFPLRKSHPLIGKRIEMPAVRRDGVEITVELSILVSALAGRALYSASVRDITEMKRHEAEILGLNTTLEQRVAQRTEELAQANQQLEAFAQNVSHDLRAPLRTIDGFLQLAAEECESTAAPAGRHLAEAGRYVRKMQHMIDDLLKLAFIGRQPVQRRVVDLREMIEAVLPDLNVYQPPAETSIADDLGTVNADPALLEHALRNLLSNAFKFSRDASPARVEIGVRREQAERVYYIRDNGVGFDPARAPRLFRAFSRLHSVNEFEGSGVGLSIVQSVIDKHGGRVWADAAPGAGATFYFTLPDAPATAD